MDLLVLCFLLRQRDVLTGEGDFCFSVPGGAMLVLGRDVDYDPLL